jgi:hypothetical protein
MRMQGLPELPEGVDILLPGDDTKIVVRLIKTVAMWNGLRFEIRKAVRRRAPGRSPRSLNRACRISSVSSRRTGNFGENDHGLVGAMVLTRTS